MNPLRQLNELGQSVWLDNLRRKDITTGALKKLRDEDGLRGLTSNPTIFQKSVEGSADYEDIFQKWGPSLGVLEVYEKLAVRDIQDAADIFRPVYDSTGGRDGFVSLEVSPFAAFRTEASVDEAHRLWKAVDRPNLMIKIPGTEEGLPAIRQLLSEGMNINITLLFSQQMYRRVAEAYVDGLEQFAKRGGDPSKVASVASFFVSRIDTLVDKLAEQKLQQGAGGEQKKALEAVMGKVAIANAKLAYRIYQEVFSSARWKKLAAQGARNQRVLWASTSTKNPKYRDVIYVEELIGEDTVNTMPPATVDAFRDHGKVRRSLTEDVAGAEQTMRLLDQAGISMRQVTDQLVEEGVKSFADSFDKLLEAVGKKIGKTPPARINDQSLRLPTALGDAVAKLTKSWERDDNVRRLWKGEPKLWTGHDEAKWVGWLKIVDEQQGALGSLEQFGAEIQKEGFTHALLLGMGGSSLCPELLAMTFGKREGWPQLVVLDSTDPAQVKTFEGKVDLAKTLFIVASKSGSTLEPNIFHRYFYERLEQAVGKGKAGRQFVAITDPGSKLEAVAKQEGFRRIFAGVPSIGGRYSALSNFGLVPAAVMGLDLKHFLASAAAMVAACGPEVPARQNPGVQLGLVLGAAGKAGQDKVTLIASPGIRDLGAWLEQLLAESTGKLGKGLVPVDREPLGPPEVYGDDRLFVYLRLETTARAEQDAAVDALAQAGRPVVTLRVNQPTAIAQELFRWEIATATAGAVLGINPFDQPDVEASKVATRKLTDEFEKTGKLPEEKPAFEDAGVSVFAGEKLQKQLKLGSMKSVADVLKATLGLLGKHDYFAVLAYVEMNPAHEQLLQRIRTRVRDARKVATCAEFGPRFLHSTGQAYKGGPDSGVFLQLTCDDAVQLPVPGQKYTFGVVKAAQARGDLQVLQERKRRALRIHLRGDVGERLGELAQAVEQVLAK